MVLDRITLAVIFLGIGGVTVLTDYAAHAEDGPPLSADRAVSESSSQSIQDILVLLDAEKPDPAKIEQISKAANAEIPANLKGAPRAEAFFQRAEARVQAGRMLDGIADTREAIKTTVTQEKLPEIKQNYGAVLSRFEQYLQRRARSIGDYATAIPIMQKQANVFQVERGRSRLPTIYEGLYFSYLVFGDTDRANQYLRALRGIVAESNGWSVPSSVRDIYRSAISESVGYDQEIKGQFALAETSYSQGIATAQRALDTYSSQTTEKFFPYREEFETGIDRFKLSEARVKLALARNGEAEAEVREVLLRRLHRLGKNHEDTGQALVALASVLIAEGRYDEATQLIKIGSNIFKDIGYPETSPRNVANQLLLAEVLVSQHRSDEAKKVYDEVDRLTASWEPARREITVNETGRIAYLINAGRADDAIALATLKRDRERARSGDGSPASAVIRGYLAAAYAKAGRDTEAMTEFKAAIPVLLARQQDEENTSSSGTIIAQNRFIIERYMSMIARNPSLVDGDAGDESFGLVDKIRNLSVQRALAEASSRSAAKDPSLGTLARAEQDIGKQLAQTVDALNKQLALTTPQRDAKAVASAQSRIVSLRDSRNKALKTLADRFPAYANLVNPPPVKSSDIRAVLNDDEVYLSFYFGDTGSFVWAVRKTGPMQFVKIDITGSELDQTVAKLREALEPQASTIGEIPPFDVTLAYHLYEQILKPVEPSFSASHNIIVTTNGALGLLPLSLLPTTAASIDDKALPLFSSYRNVTWLAREHAITVMPSASSLLALRATKAHAEQKDKFIGFGDPIFQEEKPPVQADAGAVKSEASQQDTTSPSLQSKGNGEANNPVQVTDPKSAVGSSAPVDGSAPPDAPVTNIAGQPSLDRRAAPPAGDLGAELERLPRLPDTADELRSIADILGVDQSKSLFLGKDANEKRVKTTNLSTYRFVAFATHGLMTNDLDGLSQPALALSAPKVAGVDGDGLLTMEEILPLKLNADWVILSACNTGAGAGAGADAASGLGRAFFYAGARALLVTNWSIHSQSARELITDTFRRIAADGKLSESEALRQAAMALIDGSGNVDAQGQPQFSYAHPLFWAPYTLIGDGDRR